MYAWVTLFPVAEFPSPKLIVYVNVSPSSSVADAVNVAVSYGLFRDVGETTKLFITGSWLVGSGCTST